LSTFAAGNDRGCRCAGNDTAHEIKEAGYEIEQSARSGTNGVALRKYEEAHESEERPQKRPICNSATRNNIPLASQTGQGFMVGNNKLNRRQSRAGVWHEESARGALSHLRIVEIESALAPA
jgi:hypothetical protein